MTSPSNITCLNAWRQPRDIAAPVQTIAVTGGKGGVGKSVVCANLAIALAQASRRVLLFDADLGLANADLLLGVRPRHTLRDVLRSDIPLRDAITPGPAGIALVPGSSGFADIANLGAPEQAGIIAGFGSLARDYDVLCVDTGPGLSDSTIRIAAATQQVVVVVCDEPTSLTDAYAIIKVLYEEQGIDRFRVVTNMVRNGDGAAAWDRLRRVAEKFLPVVLYHEGSIPFDERVVHSVRSRTPVLSTFPRSLAAIALRRLAQRAAAWPVTDGLRGNLQFFAESLVQVRADGGAATGS